MENQFEKIKSETKQQIIGYITAAFGLVAGLAWNEAIKSLIEYFFPISQNSLLAKLIYAILMTLIVVTVTIYIVRLSGKKTNS